MPISIYKELEGSPGKRIERPGLRSLSYQAPLIVDYLALHKYPEALGEFYYAKDIIDDKDGNISKEEAQRFFQLMEAASSYFNPKNNYNLTLAEINRGEDLSTVNKREEYPVLKAVHEVISPTFRGGTLEHMIASLALSIYLKNKSSPDKIITNLAHQLGFESSSQLGHLEPDRFAALYIMQDKFTLLAA